MAASKEYELLFRLTAQLDNAFNGKFSTARSVMSDLQTDINNYNNLLRDISAYQQQESALQGLESALSEQKQKLAEVTAALQEAREQEQAAGVDIKALTEAKKQHEAQITSLNAQLKAQRAELANTNAALKEEEAQIASIRAAMKEEGADTDALTADLKEHQAAADALKVKKKEQEAAVASLTAQLKNERVGLDETTAAIKTHRDGVGALEEKQKSLQADVDGLTGKVNAQKKILQDASAALRAAGVDTGSLDKEIQRIGQSSDETRQKMEAWQNTANKLSDMSHLFSSIRMVADQMLDAVNVVTDGIEASVESAANLEYSMSAVEAISGANAAEMGQLTAMVKEQGATTVYTAQECAEALQTEALAGWEVSDMLAGLPAVVSLAAAAGEDLASMSSIVSDALNAFGLDGQAAVTKFADVLVKGATSSNTTVALLGESLSYVETTAGNMGYSIEDVTLALAQMANNALKGGVAGSALNTMLTRMSGANATAAKEMERLGLSMFDSNGQAKPLLEFLNELRGAFQNMAAGGEEAQQAAYKLAGLRGMRGLLALVNASDEEWNKLTDDIYAYSGAASTISDVRLDNYTGQVTLLQSAWEALKNSVGEAFLPAATNGAKMLTGLTNAVDGLVQKMPNATVGVGAFFYTLKGGLSIVTGLAPVLMAVSMAVNAFGPQTLATIKSMGLGLGGLAVGIGAFAGTISWVMSEIDEGEQRVATASSGAQAVLDRMNQEYEAFSQTMADYDSRRETVQDIVADLEQLTTQEAANDETKGRIAEKVQSLNELLPDLDLHYDELNGTLSKTTEEILDLNKAMSPEEYQARKTFVSSLSADLEEYQRQLKEFGEEEVPRIMELKDKFSGRLGPLMTLLDLSGFAEMSAGEKAMRDMAEEGKEYNAILREQQALISGGSLLQAEQLGINDLSLESLTAIEEATYGLNDAYMELYQSTLEAARGQYAVWDSVEEFAAVGVADLQSALQTQLSYWQNYNNDLQTVLSYIETKSAQGYDTSGIEAYIASFDGSEESAAAIAGLADAAANGSDDLLTLGQTYSDVMAAQEAAAGSLTEATGQLDAGVQEAMSKLDEAIRSAENYDGAYHAMMETLRGLEDGLEGSGSIAAVTAAIGAAADEWGTELSTALSPNFMFNIGNQGMDGLQSGITSGQPGVTSAAQGVGSSGKNALEALINSGNGYSAGAAYGRGVANGLYGQLGNVRSAANALSSAARVSGGSTGKGYATGTQSATPGLHVVGENGPEIVYFNGGEQVLNARETAAIMAGMTPTPIPMVPAPVMAAAPTGTGSGTVIQLSYAPVITVEGAAGADEIRQQLEEHDEALRDMLDEWITEREEAQQRVRY